MRASTPEGPTGGGEPPTKVVALRPRWVWALFALLAFAIPLAGWLLERSP